MTNEVYQIKLPEKLQFLLTEKHRYKVAYGGRGSSKSFSMILASIARALQQKTRILCVRQFQNSIADSVYKLICDNIYRLKLDKFFTITQNSIRGTNGSEYIFKGIHNNVQEIKSLEGVDLCLVEEAQNIPDESWEVLIPTIRKEGSEFWICFNPQREDDATYRRFVKNPPDDCKTVLINYVDNPWFPEVLRKEMEYCKRVDYPKYEHIWLGKTVMETEAQIFKGKFEILDFEAEPYTEFYYGADWGFACLDGDTMIATNKGDVLLKNIKVGDMVLTRDGYKKVLFSKNKGKKEVFRLELGDKSYIIGTGDHRIFTKNGWTRIDKLSEREELCQKKCTLMGLFIKGVQTVNTRITSIIKPENKIGYIIGICGNTIMEKFQKTMTSTISMGTHLITKLKTLYVSVKKNIKKFITKINLVLFQKRLWKNTGKSMDIQKKTGQKEEKNRLQLPKIDVVYVKSAKKNLRLPMFIKNFVAHVVEKSQTLGIISKNLSAKYVVKRLWHLLTAKEKLVQTNVHINLVPLKEQREVYDITVENGEYFANGILVHNCDPTAVTRCFIENNCLYIDYEAGGVGVEMEELPQLFDKVPDIRNWKIRADAARPETISYMARHGFNCVAAEKWKGSIEDGIEYIRSFEKIYIHPRCKHVYEEFKYYAYKKDRVSGDILPIVVDAWNHYIDSLRYALQPYIKNRGKMRIHEDWELNVSSLEDDYF